MGRTRIEWVKNEDGTQGYTYNPITGCINHINGMCNGGYFPCYAYKLANGRLKSRYLANKHWNTNTPKDYKGYPNLDPFYPRFWEEKLNDLVVHPKKRRGIFICDMGEFFGDWIPREWQDRIFSVIRAHPQHRFYLLTKQPQNLINQSPFPANCWVGVTACNETMFTEALWQLNKIRATVKYISIEPFLGRIPQYVGALKNCGIDWVIIGAQTKPYKPPKIDWVTEVVKTCDKSSIKVFLKDSLKPLLKNNEGWTPSLFVSARSSGGTEYLRQEAPQ